MLGWALVLWPMQSAVVVRRTIHAGIYLHNIQVQLAQEAHRPYGISLFSIVTVLLMFVFFPYAIWIIKKLFNLRFLHR